MSRLPVIPRAVASKLGHYVYLYVDPRTNTPFYVGKGRGTRAIAHAKSTEKKKLTRIIHDIRRDGLEPRIEILSHSMPSEDVAFHVECAVIDAFGLGSLANNVRGYGSTERGRASLKELVSRYTSNVSRSSSRHCLFESISSIAETCQPSSCMMQRGVHGGWGRGAVS